MKSRKNVRFVSLALFGSVLLAGGGWAAARQIKSPAQVAADTAAPAPSQITATVTRQTLSSEVITRGTVRYGLPTPISLPASNLKTGTPIVGKLPKPGAKLRERSVAMTISGRPMIVLQGNTPMYRDLAPGAHGEDVRQLERALSRAGLNPGAVDGRYDASTATAVARLYRQVGSSPLGITDAQFDKVNTAAAALSAAVDKTLTARQALRTARRGSPRADVNQAQLDAAAVDETISTTRSAIASARTRIAEATDNAAIARRGRASGDLTAQKDLAAANVDLTSKRNTLNEAKQAEFEAQHAIDLLPPDALPADVETARAAQRTAAGKVNSAAADVTAAETAQRAAQAVVAAAGTKFGDDGRKAARDLALAQKDLREGQADLRGLEHKRALARRRVGILRTPLPSALEAQAVADAVAEEQRTRRELARLAPGLNVQVPADEILFVPSTPANVDSVTAKRGTPATGDLITVTNTRLAIDSALSVEDAKLVSVGQPVQISEPDLHVNITGTVRQVAEQNGTNGVDPGKRFVEIQPSSKAPSTLVNTSVALKIAVKSSKGQVLTVPTNAVSTGADGDQRVQIPVGRTSRFVKVDVGLQAEGFYEINPRVRGALKPGDRVVIGVAGASAARRGPSNVPVPTTPNTTSTPLTKPTTTPRTTATGPTNGP
jgi:Putative peptidoglycan binding domain